MDYVYTSAMQVLWTLSAVFGFHFGESKIRIPKIFNFNSKLLNFDTKVWCMSAINKNISIH